MQFQGTHIPVDGGLAITKQVKEGKAIPATGHGGPHGCETSRLSHFLQIGPQMAVRLSTLCAGRPLPPGIILVLISLTG
jgi:hypothetical protein